MRKDDPTAQIEAPKQGRHLPNTLSEEEVDALLQAPDTGNPLGLRDRAMLELLYATGLRVSELVGIRLGEVSLQHGVIRITGKGNKERLVPMGEEAHDWIQTYLRDARPTLMQGKMIDGTCVCDHARQWHDAANVLGNDSTLCARGGDCASYFPAHLTPCVCDPFIEPRGRFAGRTNVAGA